MPSKSFWQGGNTMLFPSTAPFANTIARKTSVNCKKHSLLLLNSPASTPSLLHNLIRRIGICMLCIFEKLRCEAIKKRRYTFLLCISPIFFFSRYLLSYKLLSLKRNVNIDTTAFCNFISNFMNVQSSTTE